MARTANDVGRIVKRRRESLHLTRERLVEKANALMGGPSLSTATISVVEGGGRKTYRPRTLASLARGLDWPEDALRRLRDGEDPASLEDVTWTSPVDRRIAGVEARLAELERLMADLMARHTSVVAVAVAVTAVVSGLLATP